MDLQESAKLTGYTIARHLYQLFAKPRWNADLAPRNQSHTFVFNGDNKQTEVKDADGVSIGRYFYDGEGNRVKKEPTWKTSSTFIPAVS